MLVNIKRAFAALAVAIVATFAGLTVVSSPAMAVKAACTAGRLCIWDAINYANNPIGSWTISTIAAQPGGCLVLNSSLTNKASSIYWNGSFVSYSSFTLWDLVGGGANRGVSTNGYSDANMLTSPGIASFSNVLSTVCVND